MYPILVCTPRQLPDDLLVPAAQTAARLNPVNHPTPQAIARALGAGPIGPERIAVLVDRKWPASGVRLTVGFLDGPPTDLRKHILLHMNAWAKTANVKFTEAKTDPQVRIARLSAPEAVAGYWSYLGTDILHIKKAQPTMNLQEFTMATPESEFHRVVRHETGHTLGFPHEHMRRELVEKIDPEKAIAYFGRTQGWSPDEVRAQVLTPIEESSLLGTPHADPRSIMCYQIPGAITKDGKPIVGGKGIDKKDYAFAASIYPQRTTPGASPGRAGGRGAQARRRKAA
jgi:Astacin (Peptidase family M12A)